MNIFDEYYCIMSCEKILSRKDWIIPDVNELAATTKQLAHVAKNSLVLRSYNLRYHLTNHSKTFESVGAHTNLVEAIVDRALSAIYGSDFDFAETDDGYSYREIVEAVRRHDLPENETGDIPDNGNRNEAEKQARERAFLTDFSNLSPMRELKFDARVTQLLSEMEDKSSLTGRLIFCADKIAALFMTLCYEEVGHSPLMKKHSRYASERDRKEMAMCDFSENGACRASEMWAIDYFKMRELIQYDDNGFFTALIVMYTLMVHGCWYTWREKDYQEISY